MTLAVVNGCAHLQWFRHLPWYEHLELSISETLSLVWNLEVQCN